MFFSYCSSIDSSKIVHFAYSYHFIMIIVVGVLLWLVNTYIPMDRKIKNILNVVVVIVLVIWLLKVFGVLNSLGSVRV